MERGNTRRVIAAGAIGNVLEWYDFAVYGYFAAAIGRAFFPSEDPVAQVLAAFGIFAVGFLMRPVGGALIGAYRRQARPPCRAHLLGGGDGDPDLPGRRPARLPDARHGRADPAHAPAHGPGPVGRRRIHDLDRLHDRAVRRPAGAASIGALGCCGAVGGILLGSATGALLASVMSAEALESLGLAHAVPARPAGRPRRLRSAPPCPGSAQGRKAAAARRCSRRCAITARCSASSPALSVFNSVGFYLMFVYIVSWLQLADDIAPAHGARHQLDQHGRCCCRSWS